MSLLVGFLLGAVVVLWVVSQVGFAMVRTGERIARAASGCTTTIALILGAICLLSLVHC